MTHYPEFEIAAQSDPGRKRGTKPNQDSLKVLFANLENNLPPLLILADGMGGYEGGEIASQMVVDTVARSYLHSKNTDDLPGLLNACLQAALAALQAHANERQLLSSMGSTVVLVAMGMDEVTVANVGDSRAYLLHGREMTQVSYDHSVVADLVRTGQITPLQARSHPQRNRLTQSISPKRNMLSPYIAKVPFAQDDTLILCTDGLWGVVPEAMIHAIALELPPQVAVQKLVSLANQNQGPDNISVIIARRKGTQISKTFKDDETNPGL